MSLATPIGTTVASVLERRVAALEDENKLLRNEAARMVEDVEKTEAEERYLVEDAIAKLGTTINPFIYVKWTQ